MFFLNLLAVVVGVHVLPEACALCRAIPAQLANVRLLSGVGADVSDEVGVDCSAVLAVRAAVRLLASVRANVRSECGLDCSGVWAERAAERLTRQCVCARASSAQSCPTHSTRSAGSGTASHQCGYGCVLRRAAQHRRTKEEACEKEKTKKEERKKKKRKKKEKVNITHLDCCLSSNQESKSESASPLFLCVPFAVSFDVILETGATGEDESELSGLFSVFV